MPSIASSRSSRSKCRVQTSNKHRRLVIDPLGGSGACVRPWDCGCAYRQFVRLASNREQTPSQTGGVKARTQVPRGKSTRIVYDYVISSGLHPPQISCHVTFSRFAATQTSFWQKVHIYSPKKAKGSSKSRSSDLIELFPKKRTLSLSLPFVHPGKGVDRLLQTSKRARRLRQLGQSRRFAYALVSLVATCWDISH